MQTAYFPMKYLRVTQAYGSNTITHKYGYPIDNAGKDTKIDNAYAPFDGVIKRIYQYGNTVWLESSSKVEYADGTRDYMTVSFTHDNSVTNLKVGHKIKQGTAFYQEGTNNAVGNHIHIEVTKGKFTGSGWYEAPNGQWVANNPYKPEKALVLKGVTILDDGGLKWTKYKEEKKMVTEAQLEVLYRFYFGIPTTDFGKKNYLDKLTFEQVQKKMINSSEYKSLVKEFSSSQGGASEHLPEAMRKVVKLPEQISKE